MRQIELLSPAGSWEALRAAIAAGADAVYLGIANFNMRATAAVNFQKEELQEVVALIHEHKLRVYVTVNTIIYNQELAQMQEIIDLVKASAADAIIASDMAAILYARSIGVEVHISTQLSISNFESLKFYAQFADCVVLARELTLEQIREIIDRVRLDNIVGPSGELVRVEVFAHGALCVAVSGRCDMSLFEYNSSANRGRCTQICRRPYKVTDLETNRELVVDGNYVMSPADLCTIGLIPQLVAAGIASLKIEGRGRPPEYVDTVIRCYREAISAAQNGKFTADKVDDWNKRLKTVFNRSFSQGFYLGRKWDEWARFDDSQATKTKVLIGNVLNYYPRAHVAYVEVLAKTEIKTGEEFLITGKTTGLVRGVLKEMKDEQTVLEVAKQGSKVTFKVDAQVRAGDKFFVMRGKDNPS